MSSTWMIYGANGYTGKLIAHEAKRRGEKPILAGRSPSVAELAHELGFEHRVFGLDDPAAAARALEGVGAVLHCAGPFSATNRPMLDACLRARAHYLDITGEIDVFEAVHARDAELKAAGITAIPGVGFDVVPTDCLAAELKHRLPGARELTLSFMAIGRPSRGTSKSIVEGMGKGGMIRREGKLTPVPTTYRRREIELGGKPVHAVTIPWGDVSTAYYSTGIPNVTVFMAMPRRLVLPSKLLGRAARHAWVQGLLKKLIEKTTTGPSEGERESGRSFIRGEASDGTRTLTMKMETPEGYKLTAISAVNAVTRVMKGGTPAGFLTPSLAFGREFALGIPGVKWNEA